MHAGHSPAAAATDWLLPRLRSCRLLYNSCVLVFLVTARNVDVSEGFCMPREYCPTECFVPISATCCSLPTRHTTNLFDLTPSCNHKCATSKCFMWPIPCLWIMSSMALASITSASFTTNPRSQITRFLPTPVLPVPQCTIIPPHCLSQRCFVRATCDCQSAPHPHSRNFVFLCHLPGLSTSSLPSAFQIPNKTLQPHQVLLCGVRHPLT